RGLALPNLGSYAEQSLAGAIATATHGGSIRTGTLADVVTQIRWVNAAGEAALSRRGDEGFGGVVAALRLWGIVTEITLEAVPLFYLRAESSIVSFTEFVQDFIRMQESADFVDARWFPQVGLVEIMRMTRVAASESEKPTQPITKVTQARRRWVSTVFRLMLRAAAMGGRSVNVALVRKLLGTSYQDRTGVGHEVLAPFGPRYHFGKILPGPDKVELNLPRLDDFRRLRKSHDPEGLFSSDYATRLLGLTS
ncbi:MAG: hypothetical protein J6386_21555, partial [Candidatus Synoicihabitans palmerolidicus]|nr:hypothetical protein [Candidatus Synoicihabitans palmerolidicus]